MHFERLLGIYRPRVCAILAATIFGFSLFLSLCPLLLSSYASSHQIWRGYYQVLLREDLPPVEQGRLGRDVVSKESAEVSFASFGGLEQTTVDRLSSRFDPRDPRYDPYMRDISLFFDGGNGWSRVYVPSRLPPLLFFVRTALLLPHYGEDWWIADFDIRNFGVVLITAFLYLGIIGFMTRGAQTRKVALLGSLPWLLALSTGRPSDLVPFFLLHTIWVMTMEESASVVRQYLLFSWKEPEAAVVRKKALFLLGSLLVVVLGRIPYRRGWVDIGQALLPLLANISLFTAYLMSDLHRRKSTGHTVFIPLTILRSEKGPRKSRVALLLVVAMGLATPFLPYLHPVGATLTFPAPLQTGGDEPFSWGALRRAWDGRVPPDLPDFALYVVHRAYQQGLPFGRIFTFPGEGDRVTLSTFREDEGAEQIVRSTRTVLNFDESWLAKILEVSPRSVEKLLLDQGTVTKVASSSWEQLFPGVPEWQASLFLLVLLFGFFRFDLVWTPVKIYAKKNLNDRRSRRAA
jgi:hypothetical protein